MKFNIILLFNFLQCVSISNSSFGTSSVIVYSIITCANYMNLTVRVLSIIYLRNSFQVETGNVGAFWSLDILSFKFWQF